MTTSQMGGGGGRYASGYAWLISSLKLVKLHNVFIMQREHHHPVIYTLTCCHFPYTGVLIFHITTLVTGHFWCVTCTLLQYCIV